MSLHRRRTTRAGETTVLRAVAAITATTGLTLVASGCGVAGTDFQPGAAAEVGGAQVESSQVDEYATYFCEAIESDAFGQVGAIARGELRQGVAGNLTRKLAAEQFAADVGVEPGSYYEEVRTQSRQALADLPEDATEALVDVQSADAYVNEVTAAAGAEALGEEGEDSPDPDAAAQRGLELFAQWIADEDVRIDPSLGITLDDTTAWVRTDASTSVATSEVALAAGALPVDEAGQPNPDYTSYVASLPASQRCGD